MGTCQSKVCVRVDDDEGDHGGRPTHLGEVGPEFSASIETPTSYRDREPRIELFNRSDYSVSYWVVQEDKQRTTAHLETIVKSIGLSLNAGNTGASVTGDLERKHEERTETESGVYYLMKDYRIGRSDISASTKVPFPADCEDVRVYGFFEDDGEWLPFKDKVYSISRREKIFQLTATNPNITPYARSATSAN